MSIEEPTIRTRALSEVRLLGDLLSFDDPESGGSSRTENRIMGNRGINANGLNHGMGKGGINGTNGIGQEAGMGLPGQEDVLVSSLRMHQQSFQNENQMKMFSNRPGSAPPALFDAHDFMRGGNFGGNLQMQNMIGNVGVAQQSEIFAGAGQQGAGAQGAFGASQNAAAVSLPIIINGEVISRDDPRLTPAYYAYYHSQRPLDPRLPPPLFNWSAVNSMSLHAQQSANPYTTVDPFAYSNQASPRTDLDSVQSMQAVDFASKRSYPNIPPRHGHSLSHDFEAGLHSHTTEGNRRSASQQFSSSNIAGISNAMGGLSVSQQVFLSRHSPMVSPARSPAPHLPSCPIYRSNGLAPAICNCGVGLIRSTQVSPGPQNLPLTVPVQSQLSIQLPSINELDLHLEKKFASPNAVLPLHPVVSSNKKSKSVQKIITASIGDVLQTPGMLLDLAVDQHGSRYIQQQLETSLETERSGIFDLLLPDLVRLCLDVFGNYVIQKLLEFSSPANRHVLIMRLQGNILVLSLQMYGCRVVQKALEVALPEEQFFILQEIMGNVRECVMDQNGNHVIQKAIERVGSAQIQFIVDDFKDQVVKLGMHPFGCRVIQRLLEHCNDEQKFPIMDEIQKGCIDLVQDQYGNYVIQHVLEHGTQRQRTPIIFTVIMNVVALAKHKFASNVVESSFIYATDQEKMAFVDHLINSQVDGVAPVSLMVRDQYANYVVQKIIDVSQGQIRMCFIDGLRQKVSNLRKISYGKHIISRIEKITGKPY